MNWVTKSSISAEKSRSRIARITSGFKAFLGSLLDIYLIFLGVKNSLNLILQCAYVRSQRFSSSDHKLNGESNSQYVYQVRNLMQIIGQLHREIGATGVFYYSIHFYSWAFFYFIEKISTRKWSSCVLNGGLLSFLEDPVREEEIIQFRIHMLIEKLIESNINFTRIILGQQTTKNIQRLNQKVLNHRKTLETAQPTSARFDVTSTSHSMAREISVDSLASQINHLNKLKLDSTKLWPPNRAPKWRDHIKRAFMKLYLASYVNIWSTCVVCTLYAIRFASKALKESGLDKIYAEFGLLDRLSSVDLVVFCWIAAEWFAAPSTTAIISISDQFEFANSFERRLNSIKSRIEKLKSLCENRNKSILSIRDIYVEKLIRDLRIECDNEVMEFYISFRLFREDLRNTLKIAQESFAKSVSVIFFTLLTSLIFYDRVKTDQIPIIICVTIFTMVSLDCAFISCAALHASSCHITNLVWPLIASVEDYNLKSFFNKSLRIVDKLPVNNLGVADIKFEFEYYSHSSISPHTVLLLRKIAANHAFLARSCVCRLYGSIPLDYEGIMKINFWILSSILLALTYYN